MFVFLDQYTGFASHKSSLLLDRMRGIWNAQRDESVEQRFVHDAPRSISCADLESDRSKLAVGRFPPPYLAAIGLVFSEMMFSVNEQVAGFVAEARRFCTLVESDGNEATTFEKECLAILLRPYQLVLLLPRVDPIESELPKRIPHEEWRNVRERTARRIECDQYWEVFEPFAQRKPDPTYGSISDDLADIWRELKMGLSAFESGKPNCVENAVWHWRFGFGSHWGYHVAGAIRALTAVHAAGFY